MLKITLSGGLELQIINFALTYAKLNNVHEKSEEMFSIPITILRPRVPTIKT
jgi:hypothetical protein